MTAVINGIQYIGGQYSPDDFIKNTLIANFIGCFLIGYLVGWILNKYGYQAAPIHGDLDQTKRMETLESFRDGDLRILVASDVAARGLDIPSVSHVFNFDVPIQAEDYVHRIGRTGRAGRDGKAIMICSKRDRKTFSNVEELLQIEIPRTNFADEAIKIDKNLEGSIPSTKGTLT